MSNETSKVLSVDELQQQVAALEDRLFRLRRVLEDRTAEADQALGQLSSVIDGMSEGLLVVDDNGRVRIANAPFLDLFGLGNEVIGRPVVDALRTLAQIVPLGRRASWRGEVSLGGGRVGEATAGPMRNALGGIEGVVVVVRDVSKERELETLKRNFIANISHELRTPLTTIAGFSSLLPLQLQRLSKHVSKTPDAQRFLRRIHESADVLGEATDRLHSMVDTLVDFSTLQAGTLHLEPRTCDLNALVAEEVGAINVRRERQIAIEGEATRPVWVDVDRARQVIAHILDNARKFCPDKPVSVRLFELGEEAHLEVLDRGPGLPKDRPMQVFETFWQVGDHLTDKPLGVGLGLAFCRELVLAQGGRIWAENRDGGGALFHVALPIAAAE